jgi:Tol biopolymer transport system component
VSGNPPIRDGAAASGPSAVEATGTVRAAIELGNELVDAWASWGPTLDPRSQRVAFISDRSGVPCVWVQELPAPGQHCNAVLIKLSDDPVVSVSWSADGGWLACCVATGGGVRTQVWVVRPDGSQARRVAGSTALHAELDTQRSPGGGDHPG